MTQQPDLTIPFDASVVDEEALRALRAVQRTVPGGDGGAAGNLAGGTEAVAAFGMMPGSPTGGIGGRAGGNLPGANELAPRPDDGPLERLDAPAPAVRTVSLDAAPPEAPILVEAPAARPAAPQKIGGSHEAPAATNSSRRVAIPVEAATEQSTHRGGEVTIPKPDHHQPQPEEPGDNAASAPAVRVSDVEGQEDQSIALDLAAVLADNDGSELLSIRIYGVPEGASLSHGTRHPDGSWSVAPADLPHLAFIPPVNFSGTVNLRLQATSQELNGSQAIVDAPFQVQVHAVADAPDVTVADAHGYEDKPVSLSDLGGALRDTDGSESLSFVLSGVPAEATLSAGIPLGGGRWALTPAQLEGLTLSPPPQMSGQFTLTLTAIATENEPGVPSARTSATFTVNVDPVVDAGSIGGSSVGSEDTLILLQPNFASPDQDGSEAWSEFTRVAGLPTGASLSHGSEIAPGVWQVPTADLRAGLVTIRPAEHSDDDFTLTLTATLTDSGNGKNVSRVVTGSHTVTVTAVADEPLVAARDVTGDEDQPIPLKVSAALVDTDGSETLTVRILGVPAGASLSHGTRQPDGSWNVPPGDLAHLSITPPDNFSGTIKLTLEATVRESSNGSTAIRSVGFQVDVEDVSDAPLVSVRDATGREDEWAALDLRAALTDTDGSETLAVTIIGVPADARLSHGSRASDGSWKVLPEELADLAILPPENFSGTINLTLRATSLSQNGSTAVVDSPFRVHVDAVADTPVVAVHDAATHEDRPIALDLSAALTDTDGSEVLSVVIEGLPAGSRLSAGNDNGDGSWTARIQAPPVDGKANAALIALVARHFGVAKSAVSIKSGAASRSKRVVVEGSAQLGPASPS